jgi:hypothetical protein
VWDNLNTHVSRAMRELAAARPWLTVFQPPAYASDLNPVEAVVEPETVAGEPCQAEHRSADRAGEDPARRMQYRPGLLDGFLAKTGYDLGNSHH